MPRKHVPLPRDLHPSAHGGILRRRSRGRGRRPLSTSYSMHLVLRSSQARGPWSFAKPGNREMINTVLAKQAARANVVILGTGNSGNHLHLRVQFERKAQYFRFIRAVAGEIALKIKQIANPLVQRGRNLWDQRPFSSIISGSRYVARVIDYLKINEMEGHGFPRAFARLTVSRWLPRQEQVRRELLAVGSA